MRRFLLIIHFFFAFAIGLVPTWGQESVDVAQEILPSVTWNGESVAVICPPMFRKVLEPWVHYRMNQGYKVYVLEEPKPRPENGNRTPSPQFLKLRIRALVQSDPSVKYLLLIGDATPEVVSEPTASERLIPAARVKALVISDFGKEKDIATDNYYADLSDDNMPELAVGRLTADTAEELSTMIAKIIRYENETRIGFWYRRINLVAGVGGFSPLIDTQIESTVRYILSEMIDESYDLSLTQTNWKSAYCPPPELFRSVAVERLNEGCLFWVYMGHGYHKALDTVRTPQGDYAIFVEGDSQYVHSREGLPIAVFCACYTGAFDAIEDCIAEDLLRQPDGPVAIIASSRVAMPYGIAVFGLELLDEALSDTGASHGPKNLGTIFLNAKRNMLASRARERNVSATLKQSAGTVISMPANAANAVGTRLTGTTIQTEKRPLFARRHADGEAKQAIRGMIDTLAWWSDPTSNRLNEQLVDHVHLFHLFGDPLLRLPLPERLHFDSPKSIEAGSTMTIRGKMGQGGGVILAELATPRIKPVTAPKERTPFKSTEEANGEFLKTYLAANNRSINYVWHKVGRDQWAGISGQGEENSLTPDPSPLTSHPSSLAFELELPVPDDLAGEYVVRLFSTHAEGVAIGSAAVTVTPKNTASQGKRVR